MTTNYENYRTERENMRLNGVAVTYYKIFERDGNAYILQGCYAICGFGKGHRACVNHYLKNAP
jgi:hypothetical protein